LQRHPKYLNGDCSEEELYIKFLNNFETDGVSKKVAIPFFLIRTF
jgi:hypothetical protein